MILQAGHRRTLRERLLRKLWVWTGWRWTGESAGRLVEARRRKARP